MKTFKQHIAEGSSNLPPGHRQIVVNTHHTAHGKIVVVHHGANFTAVLHPQHIEAIKKLPVGGAHHFKDEQGHKWRAVRGDNYIHLKDQDGKGNYETHVPAHHIVENYREKARQGIGFPHDQIHGISVGNFHAKQKLQAPQTFDYYHPHTGDKREGYLTGMGATHYHVRDAETGKVHKFKYDEN